MNFSDMIMVGCLNIWKYRYKVKTLLSLKDISEIEGNIQQENKHESFKYAFNVSPVHIHNYYYKLSVLYSNIVYLKLLLKKGFIFWPEL